LIAPRGLVVRIAAAALALAALVLAGRALGGELGRFVEWVASLGAWAPVGFIAGYALATVLLAPASVLTLAAGAVFGLAHGIAYVFVGAMAGAAAAFLVARHFARGAVERRLAGSPRVAAIDRAVARDGRRIVLLLRLTPVVPFNFLNYALGLSRVGFGDYIVASLGILPGTIVYVYYGTLIRSVAELSAGAPSERGWPYYALLGVGLVATVVVTAVITRLARRALDEATGGDLRPA
jgi:uncharacterized membrane protein YdjX (TVP38/TMEM64 family)